MKLSVREHGDHTDKDANVPLPSHLLKQKGRYEYFEYSVIVVLFCCVLFLSVSLLAG